MVKKPLPYQPALQRPQPFARPLFGMDQITRISPEAHQAVLDQLHPSEAGASANMGWFEPFEAGKPTAFLASMAVPNGARKTRLLTPPLVFYMSPPTSCPGFLPSLAFP